MKPDDDASYYDAEFEIEGLAPIEESEDSYDSGGATKGSEERLAGLGANEHASRSMVVIRPLAGRIRLAGRSVRRRAWMWGRRRQARWARRPRITRPESRLPFFFFRLI